MGFVRADAGIEAWLDQDAQAWERLSDGEYTSHIQAWKLAFEPFLSERSQPRHLEGSRAARAAGEVAGREFRQLKACRRTADSTRA